MPRPARDPRSIRPGLRVFALLFLTALVAGAAGLVARTRPSTAIGDGGPEDPGGRRIVLQPSSSEPDERSARLADPGAQGSAREAWASVSTGEEAPREPLPPLVEALVDPQMRRFHAEYSAEAPPPFPPIGRRARVLSAQGIELSDDRCELRVLPVAADSFNCLVRVVCGRTVLYPNRAQTAGYMSCELGGALPTQAADSLPTVVDGDPAVSFDLARGTVTVRDADAEGRTIYDVTLQLDPAASPVI